nr:hypothetical protein F41F3.5 - Caenorhabditis elegans [Caenorhabditis elegans]
MDSFDKVVAVLILLNGLLGVVINTFVIYIYFNGSQDKNSFNLICLSRAINNIIMLVLEFLLLYFPVYVLSSKVYPDIVTSVINTFTINSYLVNQLQTVAIALNRFIALFAPLRYNTLCSNQVAWVTMQHYAISKTQNTIFHQTTVISQYHQTTVILQYHQITVVLVKHTKKILNIFSQQLPYSLEHRNICTYVEQNYSKIVPVGSDLIVFMPFMFLAITIVLNLMTFAKILRFYFVSDFEPIFQDEQ